MKCLGDFWNNNILGYIFLNIKIKFFSGFPIQKKWRWNKLHLIMFVYKAELSALKGPECGPLCFYSFHLHFCICGEEF